MSVSVGFCMLNTQLQHYKTWFKQEPILAFTMFSSGNIWSYNYNKVNTPSPQNKKAIHVDDVHMQYGLIFLISFL